MTRETEPGTGRALVRCDGCGYPALVLDETDLPRTWAARIGPDQQVRHFCRECDPGPSVGKGTAGRRP